MSGLDKAYLKSGMKDKVVTGEYETRKMGLFSSKRKKKLLIMREEVFNQSKEKQVQIE